MQTTPTSPYRKKGIGNRIFKPSTSKKSCPNDQQPSPQLRHPYRHPARRQIQCRARCAGRESRPSPREFLRSTNSARLKRRLFSPTRSVSPPGLKDFSPGRSSSPAMKRSKASTPLSAKRMTAASTTSVHDSFRPTMLLKRCAGRNPVRLKKAAAVPAPALLPSASRPVSAPHRANSPKA